MRSAINCWLLVVGTVLGSAKAGADEYRFGEWQGEIALADSPPVRISAYHFDEEKSSSLQLMCTPAGWDGVPEGETRLRYHGMLMELSPGVSVGEEQQACTIRANAVSPRGEERIESSDALCEGSVVDVSNVDRWARIQKLLLTAVYHGESGQPEVEPPRITVFRRDGSEFTFVSPVGQYTSVALSWMNDTCSRLRKSEGRILVPGRTYGVWFTRYRYDEFHERILPASVQATAKDGDNEVLIGCDGRLAVGHRTESCVASAAATPQPSQEPAGTCRIFARIDGGPAIGIRAWCDPSLCFFHEAYDSPKEIVPAMRTGKRARIRVSGSGDARRRDFGVSLWGFESAHDWVVSKCASLSEAQ